MLKNYFKIAFRNLVRRKLYSFINIFGLAVGLSCTLIIGMWVYQESSYDRHFVNADRIYRVGVNFYNIGDLATGPPRFVEAMRSDISMVQQATYLHWGGEIILKIGLTEFEEDSAFYADSSFFNIFSYDFITGNPTTALDVPKSVVMTENRARLYFGSANKAMGKSILVGENEQPYIVTGIVRNSDFRSHIPAQMWLSDLEAGTSNWTSASVYNYVLLQEGTSLNEYRDALDRLVEDQIYPTFNSSQSYEDWKTGATGYRFIPMNIQDIYLHSDLRFEIIPTGNATNVKVFGAVALFILLLAGINFVNIVTARGATRAREVGIRKTLGTARPALIVQFLLESVFLCLIAMVLALALAEQFLTIFEEITGLTFLNSVLTSPSQILWMVLVAIFVGLIAGIYPAFYLTRFNPVSVLKGTYWQASSAPFRNALVVSQFAVSICLIICAGVVYQQLNYMQSLDMGLNRENVLVLDNFWRIGDSREAFTQQVRNLAGVEMAGWSNRIPAGTAVSVSNMRSEGMEQAVSVQTFRADESFLSVMGFRLLKGRNFNPDLASDTAAVILNQSAVHALELGEEPVGIKLDTGQEVVGVVSDFNYENLRSDIAPTAIEYIHNPAEQLFMKIRGTASFETIESLQGLWSSFGAEEPMSYYFLDRNYRAMIRNEEILSQVVTIFTLLAIFISCLGLYGLSSYITAQRTKEVGIRRILGASMGDILLRLNWSFTLPVGIAIFIAVPAAYLIINRWLANFAYKADVSPWIFIGASMGALLIAWLTVSWQSIKTANLNPVESLRSE